MKHIKKHLTRNVGPTIHLSPEFRRKNYTETIERMVLLGIMSPEYARKALENVERLEA